MTTTFVIVIIVNENIKMNFYYLEFILWGS